MPSDLCRLCMKKDNLICIFEERNTVRISTIINELAKLTISPNDGLPSKICFICLKNLDACTEFLNMCQNTDEILRSSVQKNNEEIPPKDLKIEFDENNYFSTIEDEDNIQCSIKINQIADNNTELKTCIKSNKAHETKNDKNKSVKQQCFTCGKVMSSMFRLKTHLRTHTGERPFTCPHCSRKFALEQSLKVHMRVHTGEKPLQCSICGESFAHTAGLATHKRKHTGQMPYLCTLCPRRFRTNAHLKYHIRRHTGEENFECEICNKAFITGSSLKQHLLSHTGDRPHVCSICGKRMARASHVKRHMQQVHHKNISPKQGLDNTCQIKNTSKN